VSAAARNMNATWQIALCPHSTWARQEANDRPTGIVGLRIGAPKMGSGSSSRPPTLPPSSVASFSERHRAEKEKSRTEHLPENAVAIDGATDSASQRRAQPRQHHPVRREVPAGRQAALAILAIESCSPPLTSSASTSPPAPWPCHWRAPGRARAQCGAPAPLWRPLPGPP
jgi:hypothetical protein